MGASDERVAGMGEFVRLRFLGGRFERPGVGMPVEVLADLVAYRELLVGVAKVVYRRRHPGRSRIPKHFVDSLELQLREVRPGSRMPVLDRPVTDGQLQFYGDEYAEAQRLIESVFGSGRAVGEVPSYLPATAFSALRVFGRLLGPDEAIEFYRPDGGEVPLARLDGAKRLELLGRFQGGEPLAYEQVVRIVSVRSEVERAGFRTGDGETLEGHYEPELFETIKNGIQHLGQGNRHLLRGTVLVSADGTIRALESIESLEDVEVDLSGYERARREMVAVAELEDGWFEGNGLAVTGHQLESARRLLDQLEDARLPAPVVVSAAIDGALRLEWHRPNHAAAIDIEQDGEINVASTELDTPSWMRTYAELDELFAELDEFGEQL